MTKQEIRQAYLNAVEPKIISSLQFADNPLFDKLRAFCNIQEGYSFFHPFSGNFDNNGMDFPDFCELWSWLEYCWDDDGSTAFISASLEYSNHIPHGFNLKPIVTKNIFVMRGEHNYLALDRVEKQALKHNSSGAKLVGYVSTIFRKSDVEFLYDLIPEFERIRKLRHNSNDAREAFECLKEHKKIYDIIHDHIKSSEYAFIYPLA